MPPHSAMTAIIQTLAILHCLSAAFAHPPNPKPLSLILPNPDSIANTSNTPAPTPLTTDSIECLRKLHPAYLLRPDCRYILDEIFPQQPHVLRPRIFKHNTYETDSGTYARSRWFYRTCEVEVYGNRKAQQTMSLLDIAGLAGQIFEKCVNSFVIPIGGLSLIGDKSKGFHVILQGISQSLSATNSNASQSLDVSVYKRAMRSQSNTKKSAELYRVETRHRRRDSSLMLVHPSGATNSTSSLTAAWSHLVTCSDARLTPLQETLSRDCNYIANQIIYNLFDPEAQMTFGFTDAADINLSRPEYRKWQYGRCMVSLRNDDETQVDTFSFFDVIATAIRINGRCVVDKWEKKQGGTARVGALEHLFYVYLGPPEALDSVSSDATLSRRRSGAKGIQR